MGALPLSRRSGSKFGERGVIARSISSLCPTGGAGAGLVTMGLLDRSGDLIGGGGAGLTMCGFGLCSGETSVGGGGAGRTIVTGDFVAGFVIVVLVGCSKSFDNLLPERESFGAMKAASVVTIVSLDLGSFLCFV